MRIASLDELGASSSAGGWSSPGRADIHRNKKVNEMVRAFVCSIMIEGDIVVASDSKSKLWKNVSLIRAIPNWNMKCVDVARSPGSSLRVFTSSERLANYLKINEIGEVEKLAMKIEMDDPEIGKLVKKNEMGDPRVGEEDRDGCLKQES